MKFHDYSQISIATLSVLAMSTASLPAAATIFHNSYTGSEVQVFSTTQFAYSGDVSNSDLINGMIPVTTGGTAWNTSNEARPQELSDGSHGVGFNVVVGDRVQGAWTTVGATAIYNLGPGAQNLGYSITSLQSIADWNGAGFPNQAWTLSVRLVGSGTYLDVATIDYRPVGNTSAGTTKVTLSGLNITGIEYLRVTANSAVNPNANAFIWRELDVIGSSTVPEPSSFALVGLGALALLRRRR